MTSNAPGLQRDILPDLLRAFALIGIVMVNVELFSASKMNGYSSDAVASPMDHWAHVLTGTLFTFKSYSLFSMMFGAGLGYQLAAADRQGTGAKGRYFRRMLGLLVLGALHAIFLFIGDILVAYAILGSLLWFLRHRSPKALFVTAGILLVIQTLVIGLGAAGLYFGETFGGDEFSEAMAQQNELALATDRVFADGSFLAIAGERLKLWPGLLFGAMFFQGIGALAFFLIGLGFYKNGWISDPKAKVWKWARWYALPIGLLSAYLGSIVYADAGGRQTAQAISGYAILMAGSAFSTLGYAGWIAKLCSLTGPVLRFLARGGSATLSAYLMQSVLMCLIMLPFGLGLYLKTTVGEAFLIALGVGLVSLISVSLWRKLFARGPVEILFRRWVYLGKSTPPS